MFVRELMRNLRPITLAFILVAAISVMRTTLFSDNTVDAIAVLIFTASLIAIRKFKANFVFVLLSCGIINVMLRVWI